MLALTAAKLGLLLGVCLILETFYGLSNLTCSWIDLVQAGPLWKGVHFGPGQINAASMKLIGVCLFFVCVLGSELIINIVCITIWLWGNIGATYRPVLRAKLVYHQPASGAVKTHDRTWWRHAIHAGSWEEIFSPQHVSTTNNSNGKPFFIIWQPCEFLSKGCSL